MDEIEYQYGVRVKATGRIAEFTELTARELAKPHEIIGDGGRYELMRRPVGKWEPTA